MLIIRQPLISLEHLSILLPVLLLHLLVLAVLKSRRGAVAVPVVVQLEYYSAIVMAAVVVGEHIILRLSLSPAASHIQSL